MKVDNTMRVDFDRCEKLYYWRHKRNLVPKGVKDLSKYFGGSLHKGVEARDRGLSQPEVMKAFGEDYAQFYSEELGDEERTIETGFTILSAYLNRYKDDYLKPIKDGVEVGFAVEVSNDLIYTGRIDMIGEWDGETVVVDRKTTAYPGSSFLVMKPNSQFTGYSWAISQLLGKDVRKIIVDVIGTKVLHPWKRENQAQFEARLLREGKEPVTLYREVTDRTEEDWKEWLEGLKITVQRIGECEEKGVWPKRTHSCPSFRGCEYASLCKVSESMAEGIAETFFMESKWEPYEEDGGEG